MSLRDVPLYHRQRQKWFCGPNRLRIAHPSMQSGVSIQHFCPSVCPSVRPSSTGIVSKLGTYIVKRFPSGRAIIRVFLQLDRYTWKTLGCLGGGTGLMWFPVPVGPEMDISTEFPHLLRYHSLYWRTTTIDYSNFTIWRSRDRRDIGFRSRYFRFRPVGKPR